MSAGKNKLTRFARMYVGGYDLSGSTRTVGSLDNMFEGVDLTGWSQLVRNEIADKVRQVGIRGYQALMDDTASSGSFSVLKDGNNSYAASLLMGGGAAPAVGDPAYHIPAVQMTDLAGWDGKAAAITADFIPLQSQFSGSYYDNPFGVVLEYDQSLSSTTNETSVDNGASSSSGGSAVLQVIASSGGTWVLKVQHSTDNAAWSDLITFSANGSAIATEFSSVTGTVNRYLRFQATRTTGTLTAICTFARN